MGWVSGKGGGDTFHVYTLWHNGILMAPMPLLMAQLVYVRWHHLAPLGTRWQHIGTLCTSGDTSGTPGDTSGHNMALHYYDVIALLYADCSHF